MSTARDIRTTLFSDYENTVPRSMVHRAAVSEVFLTGAIRSSDRHFHCLAQLPRTHSYFSEHTHSAAHYDMLLLLEVFRQASIYISHAFLDVSAEDKFIYLDSVTSLVQRSLLVVGDRPASAVIDVTVVDEYVRHGVRAGVTLDMELSIDGEVVARHERMSIRWMPGTSWKKMRAKGIAGVPVDADESIQRPAPQSPRLVGRQWLNNVVIGRNLTESPGELSASLIVDRNNPAIFDHPLDHIPGMLLLEGFRQIGLIAAQRQQNIGPNEVLLSRCHVVFTRFGEFGLDTRLRVNTDSVRLLDDEETIAISVIVEQGGTTIATAQLELLPVNSGRASMAAPLQFAVGI
jgi:hypothetical protein